MSISSSVLSRGASFQALVIGIFIGANAALPMYLWQSNAEMAIACFVIVGYSAWMIAATRVEIAENHSMRQYLCRIPVNKPFRRVLRMLADPGFWWSLTFGSATITGAVWYAGFRNIKILIVAGIMWGLLSVLLNFGLTLLHPTTRCRRCKYELAAHLDSKDPNQTVRCPECGRSWEKSQLLLSYETSPPRIRWAA